MSIWNRLSLTYRFGIAAGLVMIVGMLVIGAWVEDQIRVRVTDNAAATTALFLDSILAPLTQELATADNLSVGPATAIIELMNRPGATSRFLSMSLWKPGGKIAFSTDLDRIGKTFEPSEGLKAALKGEVTGVYNRSDGAEAASERVWDRPVLEIYAPLRAKFTGEIIAVAEIYEDASALAVDLGAVGRQTWLVVAATTIGMALVLLGIVHSGSVLIDRQQGRLSRTLGENVELLKRIGRATARSSELSERQLRRVSADLHDGPAQLVSVAALRMGSLRKGVADLKAAQEFDAIQAALDEAMVDIRNICKGLSLPEIENQTLSDAVTGAIQAHEMRTGSSVDLRLDVAGDVPAHVKICAYRFVQEGLNNAYRHGDGSAPTVELRRDGTFLAASISNGWNPGQTTADCPESGGLGLTGLRERVESLGGDFVFQRDEKAKAARLFMRLNIMDMTANG